MSEQDTPDPEVSVDAAMWMSLTPRERAEALEACGLPQFVMSALDRSTMMIRLRTPSADELLDGLLGELFVVPAPRLPSFAEHMAQRRVRGE